ncbi:MAG: CpaF family protein [Steroidobacteraceae bacterium]|nr:CpaF family protein [Steroidobacteraceae bacterium]MCW5573851.1 CpaF family protein [Steroidobacteraceae bacterium]
MSLPAAPPADLARALHGELLASLDLRRCDIMQMPEPELRALASARLEEIIARHALPPGADTRQLVRFVVDEAIGLGPLEQLLADDSVTEIMVNGASQVFVERDGRLARTATRFTSEPALRAIIERIVSRVGRRVDDASPLVDARLPDGSRVNVVLAPLSLCGAALTIRKFARRRLTIDDLVGRGTIAPPMVAFLAECVRHRRNIVISGGTGSGKTTLLNVLSALIPEGERIVTIEDAAELQLAHANLVPLEARTANLEGRGEITIRDLVRNALRMRPDRIVVGECRGGEALDMLQAMNTGHDGSLTTAHANGPRDLLSRLEVMVLMSGVDLPLQAVREQIAAAIDLIVHVARAPCGTRRVTHVVEVTDVDAGVIATQDLFRYTTTRASRQGRFEATGQVPAFYEPLRASGIELDYSIFRREPAGGAA